MATKYSMEVCDAETGEYTPVALFSAPMCFTNCA